MAKPLWEPSEDRIRQSNMYRFMQQINAKYQRSFSEYTDLHRWSIENIEDFWKEMWTYAGIRASASYEQVIDDKTKMPGAKWFSGASLNFAENLLRYRDDNLALIFKGEGQEVKRMTYAELYDGVAGLSQSLRDAGVQVGDRVVGFMPNMPETIIAMLAATSIGATWSSCSPDFGIKGVLDRFGQIQPKVLFTADGYHFKGKAVDSLSRVADIAADLPSIETIVVVPYTREDPDIDPLPRAVHYNDFAARASNTDIEFEQLPFGHPLYIMYSSGTTGLPKCMVQSAGGILIHHMKELLLHTDLKREDTIFYFTTCGWMMWNWLTSSLSVGATLVLYDGNPFYPDDGALWQLAQDEKITVFGTSAGYIANLMTTDLRPKDTYDLTTLRTVLSTGSPLSPEGFSYIYEAVKEDLQLASIAGGTDLNGCFALGNPMAPVYAGELQCRGLGMNVHAFDEDGNAVLNQQGELVCTDPFPSMPIHFWNDPDNRKYSTAYFDVYPNVWHHGDFIEVTDRGGVIMYGRSDATLNPQGVRIGTSEIYRIMEQLDGIADCVAVGQDWKNNVRVILFVVMADGVSLTEALKAEIRGAIRTHASPRHMPAKIIAVRDVPYTLNMKKVELAVRDVIHNRPVHNREALGNPEALDCYIDLPELQED